MFFNGLPEMPVENITVKDVVISGAKEGAVISQAVNVAMENVRIEAGTGSPIRISNAKDIKVDGKTYNAGNHLETIHP
jgi:ribosomal protein L24